MYTILQTAALNKLDPGAYLFLLDATSPLVDLPYDKEQYCLSVDSMGNVRYLSAAKNASVVIGNSSSGIIEVPSLNVPVVNIGDRQKGRIHSDCVIDCPNKCDEIYNSILLATSNDFVNGRKTWRNPYEKDDTSETIFHIIKKIFEEDIINLKKVFYDLR